TPTACPLMLVSSFTSLRWPPCCALLPYTTLFRSNPATTQVSRESASLTKPRARLIKAEIAIMATMAQSTPTSVTVRHQETKNAFYQSDPAHRNRQSTTWHSPRPPAQGARVDSSCATTSPLLLCRRSSS